MRRRRPTLCFSLCIAGFLCLTRVVSGQIETQATTYDMSLSDVLAATFEHNPGLQRARADVERAAGTKLVIRSRDLPQLNGQVRGGIQQGSLYDNDGPYSAVTGQLSQPLIDADIAPTWRRGQWEVVVAQQALNQQVTEQLHAARVTFLEALYYRDLTTLFYEIHKRLQVNVEREEQRIVLGMGNQQAQAAARTQLLSMQRNLANARARSVELATRLAELCGRDLTNRRKPAGSVQWPKPVGELVYQPLRVDVAAETAAALTNRADVHLLQALIESTRADQQAIQAGYYPRVTLIASALFIPEEELVQRQTATVQGHDTRSSELRAGAAMTWNVIDNGRVTGASRRAGAARQEYEIALRDLEQDIPRQFKQIAIRIENADARRAALLKSAESAEENLKLIEARIELKSATQLDFQKAQGDLLSVRAGILETTFAQAVARAELDRAGGRYLQYHPGAKP